MGMLSETSEKIRCFVQNNHPFAISSIDDRTLIFRGIHNGITQLSRAAGSRSRDAY